MLINKLGRIVRRMWSALAGGLAGAAPSLQPASQPPSQPSARILVAQQYVHVGGYGARLDKRQVSQAEMKEAWEQAEKFWAGQYATLHNELTSKMPELLKRSKEMNIAYAQARASHQPFYTNLPNGHGVMLEALLDELEGIDEEAVGQGIDDAIRRPA